MCEKEKIKEENKETMELYSLQPVTNDEAIVDDECEVNIDDRCNIW